MKLRSNIVMGIWIGISVFLCVTGAQAEKIRLMYMTHSHAPANTVNTDLIAEFQQQHPEIEIVYDNAPHGNFEQKLLTAFAGGQGPDIFWAGDWMVPQFVDSGIIAPVDFTQYGVNSQEEFEALFTPGSLAPFTVDGKIYTGGVSEYNTFSLLYNADQFAEAELPRPSDTEPMTWEQLAEYGTKLAKTDENGQLTRVAIQWPFTVPIWTVLIQEPMLHQAGGQLLDPESGMPQFNSPEMAKVMQYLQDLRMKYKIIDPALQLDLLDDFANGNASMVIAGPWALAHLKDLNPDLNLKIAPLPVWEGGQRTTTLYAWAWFVSAKSENQELAWQFVEFLTSHAQRWWDDVRYLQARNITMDSGDSIMDYYVKTEPLLPIFLEDYTYGKFEFASTGYFELSDIWTRAATRILEGEDVQAVLEEAQIAAKFALE